MQKTQTAFISIGSNIGDRLLYCQKAVAALRQHPEIQVKKISSLYETAPVDFLDQNAFYNAVLSITTSLSPQKLLQACQEIEVRYHKKIVISKGPRTLDLDLLFYGDVILNTANLTLPHPEIAHRLFVLIPLEEIAPDYLHPIKACSIKALLSAFKSDASQHVDLLKDAAWVEITGASKVS